MAGGAGELFGCGFLNLITCRQRPIGRAGRAQDAQDATFRPAPSGSPPSRHPWLVGLSRGLCRGLRRTNKLSRPLCRCRGAWRPPPSRRSTLPPLNSTKIVFGHRHAENPRPCNPRRLRGRPSTSVGGLRAFTVRTREGVTLYACKVTFFRAFALLVRLAFRFDFL